MSSLPSWAQSACARELLSAILASPPDSRLVRDDWGIRDTPQYSGKLAGRLRRLHDEWLDRELALLDRRYPDGLPNDVRDAVFGTETSDALICRLLSESAAGRKNTERKAA